MTELVRRLTEAFQKWRPQAAAVVKVVGGAQVAGGNVVHVIDVDRRRIVFVTGQHGACLLESYRNPTPRGLHRNVCAMPSKKTTVAPAGAPRSSKP